MKKDTKQGKKPFFARLLETQELDHVVGGGDSIGHDSTNKYPSDSDEVALPHGRQKHLVDSTNKYPSDNDEVA
jgi:hypothetical protein